MDDIAPTSCAGGLADQVQPVLRRLTFDDLHASPRVGHGPRRRRCQRTSLVVGAWATGGGACWNAILVAHPL